ncbi:MAG: hypothetical protein OEL78_00520 [Hyphomicrobiales bacterium]|nr:hypothetical protein [Hyphomicrobiales bacterium]
MFGPQYFGPQYFGPQYWPPGGAGVALDTHDGSPRSVSDYISRQAARDADRNRAIFERSQRLWNDELEQIVSGAFAKVMGEEARPVQARERKRIVRIVNKDIKLEGLDFRLREIDRLIREYERLIYLPQPDMGKINDEEDAIMALLMSM